MRLNDYYKDRGIQKYNGFYLSEHSSTLSKTDIERLTSYAGRDEQSEELIFEIIDNSILRTVKLSIQLNIKDVEGSFLPSIEGFVTGYDEDDLFLDDVRVPISYIRSVVEIENKSWFKSDKR